MTREKKQSFDLAGLISLLIFAAICITFVIPGIVSAKRQTQEAYVKSRMLSLQTAAELYAAHTKGVYPSSLKQMNDYLYRKHNHPLEGNVVTLRDGAPTTQDFQNLESETHAGVVTYQSNGKDYAIIGYSKEGALQAQNQTLILKSQQSKAPLAQPVADSAPLQEASESQSNTH